MEGKKEPFWTRKVSRRSALRDAALTAGALGFLAAEQPFAAKGAVDFVKEGGLSSIKNKLHGAEKALNEGDAGKVIEALGPQKSDFEKFFHNLDHLQREDAAKRFLEAQTDLNSFDALKNLKTYESQIYDAARKENIPNELFLGLVFAESKGDPEAVSRTNAVGLTQVMPEMIESWAKDGFAPEDVNDIKKLLEFSAGEIRKYYDEFGDWGLAFWAWHAGEPAVYASVWSYFKDTKLGNLEDINIDDLGETPEANSEEARVVTEIKAKYRGAITGSGVSVHHLLTNSAVSQMFEEGDWDDTEKYCYRIAAGAKLWEANKDLV